MKDLWPGNWNRRQDFFGGGKCNVRGCDCYKERRWLLNPVRLFCRGWFRRHVIRTI